jgi:ABC-type nickel/cobalt efflux system permease component RcnA
MVIRALKALQYTPGSASSHDNMVAMEATHKHQMANSHGHGCHESPILKHQQAAHGHGHKTQINQTINQPISEKPLNRWPQFICLLLLTMAFR